MKTFNISGFGGGYEATCQKMLLRGIAWLKEHPQFSFQGYHTLKNIYGICSADTKEAKELDTVITDGLESTGAMHQAVIGHLAYIHQHGYENWIAEIEKTSPDSLYETTEEEIDHKILIADIEWQLKLDRGYNPMAELFKSIPEGKIITVDFSNEESMRQAGEKIARLLKEVM